MAKVSFIREAELPGLGKKYQVDLESGEQIVVIVHDDGRRELYHFAGDGEEPLSSVILSDQESRQLGSIIGGSSYQPRTLDRLETAVADIRIEWVKVKERSEVAGRSIGELGLRKNHGIVIVAVMEDRGGGRRETLFINPGPDYVFKPGHTVIAAGKAYKIKDFEKKLGEKV